MEKVYLKRDEVSPYVECDYGFIKDMLLLGCIYVYRKGDKKYFIIMILLHLLTSTILLLMPIPIILRIMLCMVMLFATNVLFSYNYNMMIIEKLIKEGYYPVDHDSSEKLIKKGIYFKLQ